MSIETAIEEVIERAFSKFAASQPTTGDDPWLEVRRQPAWRAALREIRAGKLTAFKPGKTWLIKKSDFDAWVTSHRVAPRPTRTATMNTDPLDRALANGQLRRIGGERR